MKRTRERVFTGLLGKGTYGEVYAIEDAGTQMAMKLLCTTKKRDEFIDFNETIDCIRELLGCARADIYRGALVSKTQIGIFMPRFGARLGNTSLPTYSIGQCADIIGPIVRKLATSTDMHRDIKPANILLPIAPGSLPILVDFSLATSAKSSIDDAVVTIWYRAPEIILQLPYTQKIDVWSMGLVILGILTGNQLLRTPCELSKMHFVIDLLNLFGWPSENEWPEMYEQLRLNYDSKIMPGFKIGSYNFEAVLSQGPKATPEKIVLAKDLLSNMLQVCPSKRWTWSQVAAHRFWMVEPESHIYSPSSVDNLSVTSSLNLQKFISESNFHSTDRIAKSFELTHQNKFYAMDYFLYYSKKMTFSLETAYKSFLIWRRYVESGGPNNIQTLSACFFQAISFNEDFRLIAANERYTWKKWSQKWDSNADSASFRSSVFDVLVHNRGCWPEENYDDMYKVVAKFAQTSSANKILFLLTATCIDEESVKASSEALDSLILSDQNVLVTKF